MVDPSNSSFIPKQGPVKKRRRAASRKIHILSVASFILVLASLIGSGAVYLYAGVVKQQLSDAVEDLYSDIATFNEADMRRVQDFDRRLTQASDRFDNNASVVTILEAMQDAIIDTATIKSLSLEREEDSNYLVTMNVGTDSFDSTIFQRDIYEDSNLIDSVAVQILTSRGLGELSNDGDSSLVDFIAEIEIPLESILYVSGDSTDLMIPSTEQFETQVTPEENLEIDQTNQIQS